MSRAGLLLLVATLAGCREFALDAAPPQPAPTVTSVVPTEAFAGQKVTLHGEGLDAGKGEIPRVLLGGAEVRILEHGATRVVFEMPVAGQALNDLVVATAVGQTAAPERVSYLGLGHLQGKGEVGKARLLSLPHSIALLDWHVLYADLLLGRVIVRPIAGSSEPTVVSFGDRLQDFQPLEVGAWVVTRGSGVRVPRAFARVVGDSSTYRGSGVAELPAFLPPPASPVRSFRAPVPDYEPLEFVPSGAAARLAYSASLDAAVWISVRRLPTGAQTVLHVLGHPEANQVPLRLTLPLLKAPDAEPLAFALVDPVGAAPGRVLIAYRGKTSCLVQEWGFTLANGTAQLSLPAGEGTPVGGLSCYAVDAATTSAGKLALLDVSGALHLEGAAGYAAVPLPPYATSLAVDAAGSFFASTATGVVGFDAAGTRTGFIGTSYPLLRLAAHPVATSTYLFGTVYGDLQTEHPDLLVLDSDLGAQLGEWSPQFSARAVAYVETLGAAVALSRELLGAVVGDLNVGAGYVTGGAVERGAVGAVGTGSVLGIASDSREREVATGRAVISRLQFEPAAAVPAVEERDLELTGTDSLIGLATWEGGFVALRREAAEFAWTCPGSEAERCTVAFEGYAVPERIALLYPSDSKRPYGWPDSLEPFRAFAPVASDTARGLLYLPAAEPDARAVVLDPKAAQPIAPVLSAVSMLGASAGRVVWTLELPENRVLDGVALSRDGGVLALAARGLNGALVAAAEPGDDPGGDLYVVRREGDGFGAPRSLGWTGVSAVAVAPDGTRAYVGVKSGRVFAVGNLEGTGPLETEPYAVLGGWSEAVNALVPSADGTRLAYLLQGTRPIVGLLR